MIKLENTEIVGWEAAIRGMRNPKNSWDRSDSECLYHMVENYRTDDPKAEEYTRYLDEFGLNLKLGPNDLDLMKRLVAGGPVHAKFRRMIAIYVDITAPLYWWKEFDTYKVGTVANSCSTMHKIAEKEFTIDDFSVNHLTDLSIEGFMALIIYLNVLRDRYNLDKNKEDWWQMIQLLPSSYNQKRTVMLNYEVLAGIYPMRKNHKLDEWREFCQWIEQLPYSELIVGSESLKIEKLGQEVANGFEDGLFMKPPVEEEINIEKVLIRADVVWYSDMMDGSRIVKSKNVKEPLTEKEQKCLERMWRDQGFEGDVIFYVVVPVDDVVGMEVSNE